MGIETSCDETAVAIVDGDKNILAHRIFSQLEDHAPYGGVVPEIAARVHVNHLDMMVRDVLNDAGLGFSDLSGIAATGGPGLIGGVIVGVMTGKAIASVHNKPFIAVNHLEGHALTARLTGDAEFPFLLLLVSGGHCQILAVEGVGKYHKLGGTVDDALGEAFDKTAKMMGLDYPGGPAVERLAKNGNAKRFSLPTPMKGREGCDFSFSGLKTSIRNELLAIKAERPLNETDKADMCASFQKVVGDILTDRMDRAIVMFKAQFPAGKQVVIAGGVAANQHVRGILQEVTMQHGMEMVLPPIALCTDNAAMIAWAGVERLRLGLTDGLDFAPRARWPLYSA